MKSPRRAVLRRGGLAAVAVASASLAVAGCGVSAATIRPGVAASVDGTTIDVKTVDAATQAYCTLNASNSTPPTTGAVARATVLQNLVLRAVADDINRDLGYHLQPGSYYASVVDQATDQLKSLTPAQAAALQPAYTGFGYFIDIVAQIGQRSAGSAGTVDGSPQQVQQADVDAGITQVVAWAQSHPITTDPQFPAMTVDAQRVEQASQNLSAPQSGLAQVALAAAVPSPTGDAAAYLASLPASQVCG